MKFDLFSTTCFKQSNDSFSIYDSDSKDPAFVVPYGDEREIAKVKNKSKWNIYFIPVDKNIIYDNPYGKRASSCDAMLISINLSKNYGLYFVELKDKERDWLKKGISQLEQTIIAFTNSYNCSISCIYAKKAFLCNKKHPDFRQAYNLNSTKEKFERDTDFELRINVHIII